MVHRPADRPAQRQPAHDPRLPRHPPAAARLRRDSARTPAITARHRRTRRATDPRVLNHLETERANSTRTRNLRLAAIHSLFRYAQHRHPEHAQDIARVLAIPLKRADRAIVTFLGDNEIQALLDAPDRSTWTGRRDHALLVLAIQTGLRASELTGLRTGDVYLTTGPHVRCAGKGRKNRITPLTPTTAVLEIWLAERAGHTDEPAVPDRPRRRAHPRRTRPPNQQIHRYRRPTLPDAAREASHAAHAQAHRGDAAASRRRRHHRHRVVVRP